MGVGRCPISWCGPTAAEADSAGGSYQPRSHQSLCAPAAHNSRNLTTAPARPGPMTAGLLLARLDEGGHGRGELRSSPDGRVARLMVCRPDGSVRGIVGRRPGGSTLVETGGGRPTVFSDFFGKATGARLPAHVVARPGQGRPYSSTVELVSRRHRGGCGLLPAATHEQTPSPVFVGEQIDNSGRALLRRFAWWQGAAKAAQRAGAGGPGLEARCREISRL